MKTGRKFSRRRFLGTTGVAAGAVISPGILRARTLSSAPIKVGVNLPVSGVYALVGQEANKGIEMYLETINRTAAGRKIEVYYEDETVQVSTGVAHARKLLQQDGVQALLGGVATPIIYATAPLAVRHQTPYVITVGGGAAITRKEKRNPYSFRTSYNIWAETYPFARWIAQNRTKKMYIFCPDYAAGKEFSDAFKAGFASAGGTVVGEFYAPLQTPDFVPLLTKVVDAKPEGVFGFWPAATAIRFLKAADQLGLNRSATLYLTGFSVDYDTLPKTGNSALGTISIHPWNIDLPNKDNQTFVKAYEGKYQKKPSYLPLFGWDAMHSVVSAIERVKGDVEDKEKFAHAFAGLSFDSPRGRMLIDAHTHDIVQDMYVREAVKGEGDVPTTKVIATLKNAADPFPDR
jgi:branched-chain amino acid transport system substrate-binding protein